MVADIFQFAKGIKLKNNRIFSLEIWKQKQANKALEKAVGTCLALLLAGRVL